MLLPPPDENSPRYESVAGMLAANREIFIIVLLATLPSRM
jgi:hypothetical protein